MPDSRVPARLPEPSATEMLRAIGISVISATRAAAAVESLYGYWTPRGAACADD